MTQQWVITGESVKDRYYNRTINTETSHTPTQITRIILKDDRNKKHQHSTIRIVI